MDLPWNPAVLEQCTGRVHRLGQKAHVQTINLVAQGTIEEGILSLLAFKKSLFAGALDGGESDVFFLGGAPSSRNLWKVWSKSPSPLQLRPPPRRSLPGVMQWLLPSRASPHGRQPLKRR